MPNWIHNRLTISATEKIRHKILDLILTKEDGEYAVDFNIAVPMPEELHVESGSRTSEAVWFYLSERLTLTQEETEKRIEREYKDNSVIRSLYFHPDYYRAPETAEAGDKLYALGQTYLTNMEKYGALTWYEWSINNWGVKWNAHCTCYDGKSNVVEFDTPWGTPFEWLKALNEKVQNMTDEMYSISCEYADEDMGNNCGGLVFDRYGYAEYYPDINPLKFACDVWGYDYDEYVSEIESA